MQSTMLHVKTTHIKPAYGRTYKTFEDATADFEIFKDFKFCKPYEGGPYLNKSDLLKGGFVCVYIFLDSNETYGGMIKL